MDIMKAPEVYLTSNLDGMISDNFAVKVTGTNKDDSGPKKPVQRKNKKVQPNDPCPCGKCYPDGRPIKYKNCCGRNQ